MEKDDHFINLRSDGRVLCGCLYYNSLFNFVLKYQSNAQSDLKTNIGRVINVFGQKFSFAIWQYIGFIYL